MSKSQSRRSQGTESTGPDDDGRNRLKKAPAPQSTNERDDADNKKRNGKKDDREGDGS